MPKRSALSASVIVAAASPVPTGIQEPHDTLAIGWRGDQEAGLAELLKAGDRDLVLDELGPEGFDRFLWTAEREEPELHAASSRIRLPGQGVDVGAEAPIVQKRIQEDQVVAVLPQPDFMPFFVLESLDRDSSGGSDGIRTRDLSLDRAAC